jgi:hypothetical protein
MHGLEWLSSDEPDVQYEMLDEDWGEVGFPACSLDQDKTMPCACDFACFAQVQSSPLGYNGRTTGSFVSAVAMSESPPNAFTTHESFFSVNEVKLFGLPVRLFANR